MFRIIRASFNQRRKTLANGLRNFAELSLRKGEIQDALEKCALPADIRGENLSLEQFVQLSDVISKVK